MDPVSTSRPAPVSAEALQHSPWALMAGLVTVTVWGANFALQKALFQVMSPGALLFVRYLLMPMAAVLLVLVVMRGRWPSVPRADLWRLIGLGVLGHGVHVSLVTYGIHWSTAFSSALIMSCGPIFTLLILHLSRTERLRPRQVAGVVTACLGVLVFLADKLVGRQWSASGGDLVMLFAASLFSYYTVMVKPLIERHGATTVMGYATLAGCIPVLCLSAWPASQMAWGQLIALDWFLLVWASLVSAFLGWLVWGWVNEQRGVARSAPLLYLMPLVAGLGGWLFADEVFSNVKLLGAAVALGGVAWAQFASSPPAGGPLRR